jgi:hypothetical protein
LKYWSSGRRDAAHGGRIRRTGNRHDHHRLAVRVQAGEVASAAPATGVGFAPGITASTRYTFGVPSYVSRRTKATVLPSGENAASESHSPCVNQRTGLPSTSDSRNDVPVESRTAATSERRSGEIVGWAPASCLMTAPLELVSATESADTSQLPYSVPTRFRVGITTSAWLHEDSPLSVLVTR